MEDLPSEQRDQVNITNEILAIDAIQLPEKLEFDKCEIMEDFCSSLNNDKIRAALYCSIQDKGLSADLKIPSMGYTVNKLTIYSTTNKLIHYFQLNIN